MFDSRSYVLERCPSAVPVWREPVFEMGRLTPKWDGRWEIRHCHDLGALVIGVGNTEQLAWDDAARNILNNE